MNFAANPGSSPGPTHSALRDEHRLADLARRFGTPLWVLDAELVRLRLAELRRAGDGRGFDVVRYAQKANPNLALLRLLRGLGAQVDAVSAGELARARRAGFEAREILYSCDVLDAAAREALRAAPARACLGSADMIEDWARLQPGSAVALRLNPGFGSGHHARVTTGGEHSKHGIWHADFADAVARARRSGLLVSGLHVHLGSGAAFDGLAPLRARLFDAAAAIGGELAWLSAGGGIPIPYRDGEARYDLERHARWWNDARVELEARCGRELALEVEPGRYLVAEAGVLLSEVCARKRSGEFDYVLCDAGFNELARPVLYGAYHRIDVLGRGAEARAPRVVAGPLCESSDVFTQNAAGELDPRPLPDAVRGDLLCIRDTGAYGAAMSSQYNSRPLAAVVLIDGDEERLVRRRESVDDLLAAEEGLAAGGPTTPPPRPLPPS